MIQHCLAVFIYREAHELADFTLPFIAIKYFGLASWTLKLPCLKNVILLEPTYLFSASFPFQDALGSLLFPSNLCSSNR